MLCYIFNIKYQKRFIFDFPDISPKLIKCWEKKSSRKVMMRLVNRVLEYSLWNTKNTNRLPLNCTSTITVATTHLNPNRMKCQISPSISLCYSSVAQRWMLFTTFVPFSLSHSFAPILYAKQCYCMHDTFIEVYWRSDGRCKRWRRF